MSTREFSVGVHDTAIAEASTCPLQVAQVQPEVHSQQEFSNRRREPKEWVELVAIADDVTSKNFLARRGVIDGRPLREYIEDMDMTTIDRGLYFGYSKVACSLAQRVSDPTRRQGIVDKATDRIVGIAEAEDPRSPVDTIVGLLQANDLQILFRPEAAVAYDTLSKSEKVALQALRAEAEYRKQYRREDGPMTRVDRAAITLITSPLYKKVFSTYFASNITGATSDICRTVINQMTTVGDPGQKELQFRRAMELLRAPDSAKVFEELGKLMLKDIAQTADDFVHVSGEGEGTEIVFEDSRAPEPPKSKLYDIINDESHKKLSRETRLTCPALSIKGTIPLVKGMIIETVDAAADRLNVAKKLA